MGESMCRVPPEGWRCSRDAGHSGPCAATMVGQLAPSARERGRRRAWVLVMTLLWLGSLGIVWAVR